jgi:glycosyltransferase involved in cell wall biosynthesis
MIPLPIVKFYHRIKQGREFSRILNDVDCFLMLNNSFIAELGEFRISKKLIDRKVSAIPNMFNMPEVTSQEKEKVILFVGRLNILQKRVDLLLEVWKSLHDIYPEWRFWVVGDGAERANMEEFCYLNNMNRVQFFGFDNPSKYYEKASILHFTSAYEGFGNVLIEAQSYGVVPVLFDSYSAAEDIVDNKKSGFLIEPFDLEKFTKLTSKLMNSSNMLASMSKSAIKQSQKFSVDSVKSKWFELFETLRIGR